MTPDLARLPNRANDAATIPMGRWDTTLPNPDPIADSDAGGPDTPIATRLGYADLMGSDRALRHGYPCRTS